MRQPIPGRYKDSSGEESPLTPREPFPGRSPCKGSRSMPGAIRL